MTRSAAAAGTPEHEGILALARLYDRTGVAAFALALRITGDRERAERAVEAAFLSFWQRASRVADAADSTDAESQLLHEVLERCIASLRMRQPARVTSPTASASQGRPLEGLLPA